ncbi:hypothetical protein [Candidatus Albibeggiatoa sp. nov. BB20]|uniref:hypothetical protein n=1 Tax=Candidatus Albibeggiatoa sp. nov. BB20 TaxID=3162723 RepID=UPI00336548DF
MLTLFEEIKKLKSKLSELEVEQERQDQELHERIKDFEEISRLEAELLGIDYEELKQKVLDTLTFMRDTEEDTAKLESELSEADQIALQKANNTEPMIHDDEETRRLEQELMDIGAPKAQNHEHYFTICLISPDGSYSEWSEEAGGGWRSIGLGRQYLEHEMALEHCEQVQQRFPNYNIKLIEKS